LGNSWVAEQLVAFEEGLSSMELVSGIFFSKLVSWTWPYYSTGSELKKSISLIITRCSVGRIISEISQSIFSTQRVTYYISTAWLVWLGKKNACGISFPSSSIFRECFVTGHWRREERLEEELLVSENCRKHEAHSRRNFSLL
jgi:integral membrane sensor domain MASE1